jgi:hypothetical protein
MITMTDCDSWHAVFQVGKRCSTVNDNPYLAPDRNDNAGQPRSQSSPAVATHNPSHNWTPADLFEVAVRVLGLVFFAWGMTSALGGLSPAEGYSPLDYLFGASGDLAFGIAFFLFAKFFVAIAYGGRDRYSEFE